MIIIKNYFINLFKYQWVKYFIVQFIIPAILVYLIYRYIDPIDFKSLEDPFTLVIEIISLISWFLLACVSIIIWSTTLTDQWRTDMMQDDNYKWVLARFDNEPKKYFFEQKKVLLNEVFFQLMRIIAALICFLGINVISKIDDLNSKEVILEFWNLGLIFLFLCIIIMSFKLMILIFRHLDSFKIDIWKS